MGIEFQKRLAVALGVICITLLILIGWLFWNYGSLQIQVAFASEQTRIIEEMRLKALQSSVADAAGYLQSVVNYYPTGTKQLTGSRLDRIVEHDRKQSADDIVNYLRNKTGENLGENPEIWIEKYAAK